LASRFWVGGTGNWDAVTTTNWSATSGGAGGQSVPTSSDAVTLDASSGGGTVTLTADANCSTLTCGAFTGTLDFNGFNLTGTGNLSFSGTGVRTINLGSGTISTSGSQITFTTTTNLTFNAGTSTLQLTGTSATTNTFNGGGLTFYRLWFNKGTSTALVVVNGDNTFNEIKDTGTIAHSIRFSQGTTQTVANFNVNGNPGQLITITTSVTNTHALVYNGVSVVSCDYLYIEHSVATPSNTWYAGANSTDNQAVATAGSGWIFSTPPAPPGANNSMFLIF
jgi:hypothetical protein